MIPLADDGADDVVAGCLDCDLDAIGEADEGVTGVSD